MVVGAALRCLLLARIEGALDHDQSVVGLMALDIAAGRRWPIFFDGQRYMGAVEAYTAALLVALFGHSPRVVAVAPLLFFSLFAAGQYALWRCWKDRRTGHLASLFTVIGAPMFALWSIVPRGGYIEILAWAVPVLALYRRAIGTGPDVFPRTGRGQAGWGFLLGLGYFLNPLSLIVYVALAVDWTLGRHGRTLRSERMSRARWLDSPAAPVVWAALAVCAVVGLAVCCHVDFNRGADASPYLFVFGRLPRGVGEAIGVLGIASIVGGAAWWSGAARRGLGLVAGHPWFTLGLIGAMGPFVLNNLLVRWGVLPWNQSLPIWIRAPWDLGPNLRDGGSALGPLVGCSPEATAMLLVGQGVPLPTHVWPTVTRALAWASPGVVAVAAGLLASVIWRDRIAWQRFLSLRGEEPSPPTMLAAIGLLVTASLYLLQATSPNVSSVRYLLPAWIFLPGLLASAVAALRPRARWLMAALLIVPWSAAQANLWAELGGPSPVRALVADLERRGVDGIVAQTPVALRVANLSHGRIGALEFRPTWQRLGVRYASRFSSSEPVVCVVDLDYPWPSPGGFRWSPRQDFGAHLAALAERHPGKLRRTGRVGRFEFWEAELGLAEILGEDEGEVKHGPVGERLH